MNTAPFSTRHFRSAPATDRPRSGLHHPWPEAPSGDQAGHRALVLGGGGSTGNAWVIGVIAGLVDVGVDVTGAELVIGTSAGSTAAAQVTSVPPSELFAEIRATPAPDASRVPIGPAGSQGGGGRVGQAAELMQRTAALIDAATDPVDMRRRLGAAALEAEAASDGSGHARWRTTCAARLPRPDWPEQHVLIVAVDAHTGEPVVFDRCSGVDLVDAVAASTSNGFAYGIGEDRFINGGYRRSSENADLAAGYGRVLVLSPFSGRARGPVEWGLDLAAQMRELTAQGSRVETIVPDSDTEHMFGANAMDLSLRAPAARAGHDQGRALAARLAEFWSGPAGGNEGPTAIASPAE